VEDLDLARVKRSRGDLQANDLSDALMDAEAPRQAAQALLEHAKDRHTAAFWPSIVTAEAFRDECLELGITCEVVFGTTPTKERREVYERFRTGETSVISTVGVLTEGWDAPWCDCILIGRPTQSRALFVQMIGRGLRPWKPGGKVDCLVLDLRGATSRHGLASLTDLSLSPEEDESEPTTPVDDEDLEVDDEHLEEPELWTPDGPLRVTEVDLFAGSETVWLQTEDRGWWFIPVAGAFYFLYPQATGHYAVGRATSGAVRKIERLDKDLSLEYAMAWAEKYAAEEDDELFGTLSSKKARWRRGQAKATTQQVAMASGFGIDPALAAIMTKRELSDLINVRLATRVLAKVA
jgi:hypothetical protein